MDIENISITEPITGADTLNDLPGHEAVEKRQEGRDLTAENTKSYFKPWRVFINHIDSYHGKILAEVMYFFNANFTQFTTRCYEYIFLREIN